MKAYILTYDLRAPHRDYYHLNKDIRALGEVVKLMDSSWLLKSDLDLSTIETSILAHLDKNDVIAVLELNKNNFSLNLETPARTFLKEL